MEFWYYIGFGQATLTLNQVEVGDEKSQKEFEISQAAGSPATPGWIKKRASFCLFTRELVRLSFQVTQGADFTYVALDEVVSYRNSPGKY